MVLEPLNPVTLYARSYAEEAWLVALADLHQVLQQIPEARIIGGTMVTLHVLRWRLTDQMERLTLDSDLGVGRSVVMDGTVTQSLARIGYIETSGGHYERATELPTDGSPTQPTAVIDLLVPAYTSRARQNVRVGDVSTTEVLGLAEALKEPGIRVSASLKGRSGWTADVTITIPGEPAALALKAMAWQARMLDKDAFDMWRMLEVCHTANVKLPSTIWPEPNKALHQAFARQDGQAMVGLQRIARANAMKRKQLWTRVRALLRNVNDS